MDNRMSYQHPNPLTLSDHQKMVSKMDLKALALRGLRWLSVERPKNEKRSRSYFSALHGLQWNSMEQVP
jgi:hypothetical protein